MPSFCFYFQVHQPHRLRSYSYFDIGHPPFYQDEKKKKEVLLKAAGKCYPPTSTLMLKRMQQTDFDFCKPCAAIERYPAGDELHIHEAYSLADMERNLSAWRGNEL